MPTDSPDETPSGGQDRSQTTGYDPVGLIQQHQAALWRYLRALGATAELAEDIVQDTFLTVLEKPFNDYNPAATASYLRTVARNQFISHMRRAGKVVAVEDVEKIDIDWARLMGHHVGSHDNTDDMLDRLRDCLAALTDRARWALEMRFADQLPRTEIGQHLGITEHGAKNLMQRAKQQLRKCIEDKWAEENHNTT